MNDRMIVLTTALILAAMGCSEPSAPPRAPEWANNTSWTGRATMQSGVVLEVRFSLTIRNDQSIDASSSLESHFNGVTLEGGLGGADADKELVSFAYFLPLVTGPDGALKTLDGVVRTCPPQFGSGLYYLDAALVAAGEFQGTLKLGCTWTSVPFDVGTIILRRL